MMDITPTPKHDYENEAVVLMVEGVPCSRSTTTTTTKNLPSMSSSKKGGIEDQVPKSTESSIKRTTMSMMMCCLLMIFAIGIFLAVVLTSSPSYDAAAATVVNEGTSTTTLLTIRERGYLICGVAIQEGFCSNDSSTGQLYGFEIDLCRAVAAGIFGNDTFARQHDDTSWETRSLEPVQYVVLEAVERFESLDKQEIDLLFAITSQNMERNVYEPSTQKGYTFSTPYLVNGLIFAGDPDFLECVLAITNTISLLTNTSSHCDDTVICVLDGTTHVDIVTRALPGFENRILTPSTIESFYEFFKEGACNVLAGEQFEVTSHNLEKRGYTGPYEIGTKVLSKELISIVTRDGDAEFSDFCNWLIKSLFAAEELRLLGSPMNIPTTHVFGQDYESMFQSAFSVVGDYGQLYEKHLQRLIPRFDANQINLGDQAGMYTIELGNVQTNDPPRQTLSPKILDIQTRRLICGITEMPMFAELNEENEWVGSQVDFCKAVSAALFDGKTTEVVYKVLPPSSRFEALLDGTVDLLACATTLTIERDVQYRKDGVGLSFSYPTFHDRIRFAGILTFLQCAEDQDWTSAECVGLLICVTSATTQFDIISKVFPLSYLKTSDSTSENLESFGDGRCNVIVGGSVEVSNASIETWFQGEEYEIGSTSLSRESLTLVTTDEDPLWSKFVNWIVLATLYADEQGITQETYWEMPRVDLFGPMIGDQMLRNAIRAAGSYGEIWARNAASKGLDRDGRNLLNTFPLGPLLISDLPWEKPSY